MIAMAPTPTVRGKNTVFLKNKDTTFSRKKKTISGEFYAGYRQKKSPEQLPASEDLLIFMYDYLFAMKLRLNIRLL